MNTNETYYINLISRYLYGEASPPEISELEKWVKADPANADLFSAYRKTWKAIEDSKIESSADPDRDWNALESRLRLTASGSPRPAFRIMHWSLRIAAMILLAAIPAFFLYHYLKPQDEKQLTATGDLSECVLPDGTLVTLNTGATLSYPAHFKGNFRKVTLEGEAWFEVAHDRARPFIISAGDARIRVVGTSFFVNTRTFRDTREVILASGIVRVYYESQPGSATLLYPGEKAELDARGGAIVKTTNEDPNFLAWKTKHLVFSNTPLNEVAALLSGVYHTSIRLSGNNLSDCRITTTFDRQSLESVLNVLKATLDFQIRNTGAGIELSGKGCNKGG